jgi:SulP family sulfate permease
LAEYVEEPVVAGFLNAFAIFLVRSQLKVFMIGAGVLLPGMELRSSLAIASLCAGLINIIPRFSKVIPPSLFGLVVSSLLAIGLKLPIKNLSDVAGAATFAGGASALPKFVGLPAVPFSLATLKIIASTSVGVALIAALQTILASRIACDSYRHV